MSRFHLFWLPMVLIDRLECWARISMCNYSIQHSKMQTKDCSWNVRRHRQFFVTHLKGRAWWNFTLPRQGRASSIRRSSKLLRRWQALRVILFLIKCTNKLQFMVIFVLHRKKKYYDISSLSTTNGLFRQMCCFRLFIIKCTNKLQWKTLKNEEYVNKWGRLASRFS